MLIIYILRMTYAIKLFTRVIKTQCSKVVTVSHVHPSLIFGRKTRIGSTINHYEWTGGE